MSRDELIRASSAVPVAVLLPFATTPMRRRRCDDADATTPRARGGGGRPRWLERTLLYVLFVAGAPDAAALVIAGKSIARFPSFAKEEFAEYYLIGSFLSLGVAAGIGIAVRASMGLHPLVPTSL